MSNLLDLLNNENFIGPYDNYQREQIIKLRKKYKTLQMELRAAIKIVYDTGCPFHDIIAENKVNQIKNLNGLIKEYSALYYR